MESKPALSQRDGHDLVLALDFGGTKLAAAVVDLSAEEIMGAIIKKTTPVAEGAKGTLAAMIDCGQQALAECGFAAQVQAVGVSFGGPVSTDRRQVLRSNHVADWDGIPLADEIKGAFGLPAAMDNDGNAAALGEWWFGGHRQFDNLIYVQTSTGAGGGFIFGRKLYRGSGLAGEFGHYIVDVNGPQCSCGRRGCLESVCSGWAIARDGRRALAEDSAKCLALAQLSGNDPAAVNAAAVFEACRKGDPACQTIVRSALNALAMLVVNLITLNDPQVVVMGGGLTRSWDMFERYFLPVVQEQMHPFFKGRCQVNHSVLNGKELLLGAALLTQEK